ncbi:MAG: cysteine desulfurase [Proteobacteria bacterium]|nr:cysteine desulfurase [Pseudomonadota bacterium]
MTEIYLDNAATTQPLPEVVEAINQAMGSDFGNASSLHRRGLAASHQITEAKKAIQDVVGSMPWEVVFTSSGTESDSMAVLGSVPRGKRNRVVTSTVEHAAVTEACKRATERGGCFLEIGAGLSGTVDPAAMAAAVDEKTALVSIIHVANEIGTIQPVADIARLVKARAPDCLVHVDAVQALAHLPGLDYPPEVDMVSISAHKIHGPQGIAALLLRPGVKPRPLICGGDQQEGLRPGTLNLPGIVGFGVAIRLLGIRRKEIVDRMGSLTDRLVEELTSRVQGVRPLGDPACRAPGIAVLAVDRVPSEVLLHALEMRGVLASSGSACHSTRSEPPRSLRDAGLRADQGAVRLSLSSETTRDEIERAIVAFIEAVEAVRSGRAGAL